jgi:hypothetical protein
MGTSSLPEVVAFFVIGNFYRQVSGNAPGALPGALLFKTISFIILPGKTRFQRPGFLYKAA